MRSIIEDRFGGCACACRKGDKRSFAASLLAAIGIVASLRAQTPVAPAFDVASVKPNQSLEVGTTLGFQPGGRFAGMNIRLRALIAAAYGTPQPLPIYRIIGGPDWVDTEPFDVVAKSDAGGLEAGWSVKRGLMLRALLADRFHLQVHWETRDQPAYALVPARRDRKLGAQLQPSSADDCASASENPRDAVRAMVATRGGATTMHITAKCMLLERLARLLENPLRRVVVDRTGLAGTFSLDLDFAAGVASASADSVGDTPSLATALQEQLGLKLDSIRAPVDLLVIDRVERPTPD